MPMKWDRPQGVSLFYINYQLRHSSMGQLGQIIAHYGSQIICTNFNPLCFWCQLKKTFSIHEAPNPNMQACMHICMHVWACASHTHLFPLMFLQFVLLGTNQSDNKHRPAKLTSLSAPCRKLAWNLTVTLQICLYGDVANPPLWQQHMFKLCCPTFRICWNVCSLYIHVKFVHMSES